MRKLFTAILLSSLAAGAVSASARGERGDNRPQRYLPQSDGAIVQLQNDVDGRAWSAWAYRSGGEYALALSVSRTPGLWSEPRLFGLDDDLNQIQPTLTVDGRGTLYLGYTNGDGTVIVRALHPHSEVWSQAIRVTDDRGRISAPTLKVIGDSLVLGYRLGDGVELATLPLLPPSTDSTQSIYDGPDPTGDREEEDDDDDDQGSGSTFDTLGGITLRPHGELAEE